MDPYADMVIPLIIMPEPNYAEEVVPNDYLGQWVRGSESVPSNVQQLRDPYGQW